MDQNIQTNYIVYDKKCNSLSEKVIGLSSGNYNWSIKFIIDSKITEQSCSFIIPSIQEKNTILEEINAFKMNLNDCSKQQICLSEESKNIFLNDFLISKGYYF